MGPQGPSGFHGVKGINTEIHRIDRDMQIPLKIQVKMARMDETGLMVKTDVMARTG